MIELKHAQILAHLRKTIQANVIADPLHQGRANRHQVFDKKWHVLEVNLILQRAVGRANHHRLP